MKRKPRQLSVKANLIVFFAAFNAALLLILYLLTANWYNASQVRQMDTFLHTEASGIATLLSTFLGEDGNRRPSGEGDSFQDPVFTKFLSNFLVQRLNRPIMFNTTLSLADTAGRLISVSNQAFNLDPRFLIENSARIYDKRSASSEVELFSVEFNNLDYRVLQMPFKEKGKVAGWIRLACLLESSVQSSIPFLALAGLVFFLSIAINVLSAIFLVTKILLPIKKMNAAMNRVTERNLSSRLELLAGTDEISTLALTFNHTLDSMEKAYRSQEQLVSDLSHQLRTPLTSMRGAVELGMQKARSVKDYHGILESTIVGIDRITSLVNTMLTLAKLDGHIESLRYSQCDLVNLLEETIEDLAPLWEEKSIKFNFRYRFYKDHRIEEFQTANRESLPVPPSISALFVIEADALRFKQAIINLLDNAYKHTPIGGLISLELYREVTGEARYCRFVIMNDGPSIPETTLEHLFTPFYQGDVSERQADALPLVSGSAVTRGFGLGLSICRRIVEMHQGKIRAFNPVSGGAAFEIILPVKQSDAAAGILENVDLSASNSPDSGKAPFLK